MSPTGTCANPMKFSMLPRRVAGSGWGASPARCGRSTPCSATNATRLRCASALHSRRQGTRGWDGALVGGGGAQQAHHLVRRPALDEPVGDRAGLVL